MSEVSLIEDQSYIIYKDNSDNSPERDYGIIKTQYSQERDYKDYGLIKTQDCEQILQNIKDNIKDNS